MAVPKRRTSKARKRSRKSANWKLSHPTMAECPQCHEPKLAHRICKTCGHYKGREVIKVDA